MRPGTAVPVPLPPEGLQSQSLTVPAFGQGLQSQSRLSPAALVGDGTAALAGSGTTAPADGSTAALDGGNTAAIVGSGTAVRWEHGSYWQLDSMEAGPVRMTAQQTFQHLP